MAPGRNELDQLLQQGVAAMRQRRLDVARSIFQSATQTHPGVSIPWLLLGVCLHEMGDMVGKEAAVNQLLGLEPQSIRGNAMKGDCRKLAGDHASAMQFYQRSVAFAQGRQLSQEVAQDVAAAAASLSSLRQQRLDHREARLAKAGVARSDWSPRLQHALDIEAGKRQLYQQQPTAFFYPELPQRQFFDRSEFAWASSVESQTDRIRDELLTLLDRRGTADFRAYIQSDETDLRLDATRKLAGRDDWSALFLCENGAERQDIIAQCPTTWASVCQADLPVVSGWGPTVMFSLLKAKARIAAHVGMFNTRLVCHLPLIVPPNCWFRVGNEVRQWKEGELLIFDDSIEHEASNDSDKDRIILIFDIWRPELSDHERRELTALFGQ